MIRQITVLEDAMSFEVLDKLKSPRIPSIFHRFSGA